ncbi:hypothetical protein [Yoonia sediminilitoris]|uniref:Uncharacterized protein n=1 Tax=Yoonia sediminilitoris TaxID=1286148 RepID=A0A2T6KDU8_9RHOB|nr:hypothetical protein [Yoonia sediminilitoris]PUB13181.1 hypothetical protein C8N45_108102 [Yoonia sediminilitoris]RCW94516.1 hypothetical protein DFP92_108103 [Yoonia sediminilitoris]
MQSYTESIIEFADFTFERRKVVCYGLQNKAGGTTTVLNFPTIELAAEFHGIFLSGRNFLIVENGAQIICLAEFDRVMQNAGDDPRVRFQNYDRNYMMGTLAHMT